MNVENGADEIIYSNGKIYLHTNRYRDPYNFPENKSLVEIDPQTNEIKYVCSNPQCNHATTECPLFGIQNIKYVYKDYILFPRIYFDVFDDNNYGSYKGHGDYVLYDKDNNLIKIREPINVDRFVEYTLQLYINNLCYYYDSDWVEEESTWLFHLCKWDLETNEVTVLEENIYPVNNKYLDVLNCTMLFSIDDRLYFTDGSSIFSTDINYKNKKTIAYGSFCLDVLTDGLHIYYGVPVSDGSYIQNIRRMDLNGKNDVDLGIITERYCIKICDDLIFYKQYDEIPIGYMSYENELTKNIVLCGSEIWCCNSNGQNKRMIYKFSGEYENYRMLCEVYTPNYIYGIFDWWEHPSDNRLLSESDHHYCFEEDVYKLFRIDVQTGEATIIEVDP